MRTLCILLLLSAPGIIAQTNSTPAQPIAAPLPIDHDTATAHLLSHPGPVYPAIAKAAHVSGQVQLQLTINPSGHVTDAKTLSGPLMLVGAAQECVRQWTYTPFTDHDQPVPATTVVTVNFGFGSVASPVQAEDLAAGKLFFTLFTRCTQALTANSDPAAEADVCVQTAQQANQFPAGQRLVERRSADVYAATALRRNKQFDTALIYANKAIDVLAYGQDDGSGSSSVYSIRAQVEASLNNLTAADADLTRAEDFERSAIEKMTSRNAQLVQQHYIPTLKNLLQYHAQVLNSLGNSTDAEAKLAEAARL
jgi:TonB family protein